MCPFGANILKMSGKLRPLLPAAESKKSISFQLHPQGGHFRLVVAEMKQRTISNRQSASAEGDGVWLERQSSLIRVRVLRPALFSSFGPTSRLDGLRTHKDRVSVLSRRSSRRYARC